jgi:hypothetical protein
VTRLRYIVDRPRGPRGGNNESPALYRSLGAAKGNATPGPARFRSDRGRVAGRVLQLDLDEMLPIDADVDEQFQWHERQMLHHNAEMLRLRPLAESRPASHLATAEMTQLREAVAEWCEENERPKTPRGKERPWPTRKLFFLLRDLWREGKLG